MINISSIIFGPMGMGWLLLKTLAPILFMAILFPILEVVIQIKTVRYFLRKNKLQFFTFLFAIIGYIVSYFFLQSPGVSFLLSVIVTLVATVVLIYSSTREKAFYFVSLQKGADKEDWIGDGIFQYDRVYDAYTITNSDSGFIFSKCLNWSDYLVDFEFKILHISLGLILRSTNLSNLVMLQILPEGIRAHIRINGFWQMWSPSETNLLFDEKLSLDSWYLCRIQCNKSSVRIRFSTGEKQFFDRVWEIPSGHISYKQPEEAGLIAQAISVPFHINLEYGTVGFRNYAGEKAVVKDLLIEKLQGMDNGD